MTGLMETASAMLSTAEKRLEVIAHNGANATTPGYRRVISFEMLVPDEASRELRPVLGATLDERPGQLVPTGNALDLAVAGDGFLVLRDGDRLLAMRSGQFARDAEGRLIDGAGRALQQSGGGDLILDQDQVTIERSGMVISDGRPIGQVAVATHRTGEPAGAPVPADLFADELQNPDIRQGMIEQSNVVMADEMLGMMAATRSAEAGARLVQTYDDLVGKALSSLGQNLR